MREAVIVASSRTPLAKSHRGSFNMTRPDDLAAHAHPPRARQGAAGSSRRRSRKSSSAAASRTAPPGTTSRASRRCAPACRSTTAGLTVNRFCNSGLQAIVQAAHMIDARRRRRGDRRRRRVDHDDAARQRARTRGCRSTIPASTWRWAKRRKSSRSATASPARRRTNTRSSASSAPRGRSRTASSRASWRRCEVTRAVLDKKTGEKIGEEDGARRRATSATAPTRRSTASPKLPPVFDTTSGQGSVTAGNSSQLSDGASATLVMSAERAKALGIDAAARVPRLRGRRLRARRDGHRPGVRRAEAAEASTA